MQETETQLIAKSNIILKINISTYLWIDMVLSGGGGAQGWFDKRLVFPVILLIYFWKGKELRMWSRKTW